MQSLDNQKPKCRHCGAAVAPAAVECSSCGRVLTRQVGPTVVASENRVAQAILERVPHRPTSRDVPRHIRWFDALLVLTVVVFAVGSLLLCRPSTDVVLRDWLATVSESLRSLDDANWRRKTPFPPDTPIRVIRFQSRESEMTQFVDNLIRRVDVRVKDEFQLTWDRRDREDRDRLVNDLSTEPTLLVAAKNRFGLSVDVAYWMPDSQVASFRWRRSESLISLYDAPLRKIGVLAFGFLAARTLLIVAYRRRRRRKYQQYEQGVTRQRCEEKRCLDEASRLALNGQNAKALVILNKLLTDNPTCSGARQLKRLMLMSAEAGEATILESRLPELANHLPTTGDVTLYLRVHGTPYAYKAPEDAEIISVGRQRRRPAGPSSEGNDVVVRVPASDEASLRISRRHLEIQLIGNTFFAIDRSGGMTRLNGSRLTVDQPRPIRSGDRLTLAGVISLDVLIRSRLEARSQPTRRIDGAVIADGGVAFEATLGDMVTECFDG